MRRAVSWLGKLKWYWKVSLIVGLVFFVVGVVVPSAVYFSRNRHPSDYSTLAYDATLVYQVTYDSGNGSEVKSTHTLKLVDGIALQDSVSTFHLVTLYDPFPKRKVNAIIVGSATVTLAEEEIWRSRDDLREIHKKVMQTNLPIVNTAVTQVIYSDYVNYPGWPYHLGDKWTYKITYNTDAPFQPNWSESFQAEVVADDAVIEAGGMPYSCFKMVHTLVSTTNGTPAGAGVGSTITEYWVKGDKTIGPIRIDDAFSYKGIETATATGRPPAAP